MFSQIKSWFENSNAEPDLSIEDAVCIVLLEILLADFQFEKQEMNALYQFLERRFALNDHQLLELIKQWHHFSKENRELARFTEVINSRFTLTDKQQLVSELWQLAHADGQIDGLEEQKIIKIAALLGIELAELGVLRTQVLSNDA